MAHDHSGQERRWCIVLQAVAFRCESVHRVPGGVGVLERVVTGPCITQVVTISQFARMGTVAHSRLPSRMDQNLGCRLMPCAEFCRSLPTTAAAAPSTAVPGFLRRYLACQLRLHLAARTALQVRFSGAQFFYDLAESARAGWDALLSELPGRRFPSRSPEAPGSGSPFSRAPQADTRV